MPDESRRLVPYGKFLLLAATVLGTSVPVTVAVGAERSVADAATDPFRRGLVGGSLPVLLAGFRLTGRWFGFNEGWD